MTSNVCNLCNKSFKSDKNLKKHIDTKICLKKQDDKKNILESTTTTEPNTINKTQENDIQNILFNILLNIVNIDNFNDELKHVLCIACPHGNIETDSLDKNILSKHIQQSLRNALDTHLCVFSRST